MSFIRDVAPILVENCIACHNPRKSESKYVMTTFTQLAKGGQQGEGITLEPGKPDESNLVELIRPDGKPRMPYKLDPLAPEKIAIIERWVTEGAKYDGNSPGEDWTVVLRKNQQVTIPAEYPATVPITALEFSPDGATIAASGYHEITFWKTADGTLQSRLDGPGRAGLRHRLQPGRQVDGDRQRRPGRLRRRQAVAERARRMQAGARPGRDPGRRLLGRLQPRQQEDRHRRG